MALRIGKIVDDLGTPMPDAHIVNQKTKQGTISDDKGIFKIEASNNDIIEISHQSLAKKQLRGSQITGNITMLPSNEYLDEVEIKATKKKKGWFYAALFALGIGGIVLVSNSNDVEKVVL